MPPEERASTLELLAPDPLRFDRLGELYRQIADAFRRLDLVYARRGERLFVGPPQAQDRSDWSAALRLRPVTDASSAIEAVDFRIIRMQPQGAVARQLAPEIGVAVRRVAIDGVAVARHPLAGAAVELLEDPVFEGRNGIAAEDAQEPIHPFHVRVRGSDGVLLRREHRSLETGELVQERPRGRVDARADMQSARGNLEPAEFRAARRAKLEALRDRTSDEIARVALAKRIADIAGEVGDGIAIRLLDFALRYRIVLQGPWGEVRDPRNALGGTIALVPWIADFWFGAFDADALCTFVKGELTLPFAPGR